MFHLPFLDSTGKNTSQNTSQNNFHDNDDKNNHEGNKNKSKHKPKQNKPSKYSSKEPGTAALAHIPEKVKIQDENNPAERKTPQAEKPAPKKLTGPEEEVRDLSSVLPDRMDIPFNPKNRYSQITFQRIRHSAREHGICYSCKFKKSIIGRIKNI